MNAEKRRKKRLRNLICITYCSVQLLLVLVAFRGMDKLLLYLTKEDVIETFGDIIIQDDEELKEDKVLTVCIDAGHGGKDNGTDYNNRMEKDDTLRIAQAVDAYLEEKGIKVVMTRADDTFLKLQERCDVANQSQADYFVSLHRNDGEGYGVETWVYSDANEETMLLAETIMQGLETAGIQRNRGVKKGTQKSENKNYYLNIHSDMPACIVELGFMNNAADNQLFDEKLQAYAGAIGDAIIAVYQNYGGKEAQTGDGTASPEGQNTENNASGHLENTPIENVEGLDKTSRDWGQGVNTDEKNRPVAAVAAQEKYGAYNAYFIGGESPSVYLTFDEGYEYGCTESILNTLKEKGVAATFFVTEPYAKDQPDFVKRMIAEGHVVGNHSVTHPASGLPSQTIEQQKNEVMENHQYIKDNFGYEMYLFRYPAGKFSEQSLAIVNNCNYKSVFWSFAYVDYDVNNQPDPAESLKKMTDKLHPGAIYLLHAESQTNTAVLADFIDQVRAQGYDFAVLT